MVRRRSAGRLRRRQFFALAAAASCPGLTVAGTGEAIRADTIPLWRWGAIWPRLEQWQSLGFTGSVLGAFRDPPTGLEAQRVRTALDEAGRIGHALGLYLHPLHSDRFGPRGSADPADPAVRAHAFATIGGWMDAVGEHPALAHMLLNSEFTVRARRPSPVNARWWREQEGSAALTAELAREAKRRRPGLLTWTDPWRDAPVRLPPGVDMLGGWTYPHPHPLRQWITPFLRAGAGPDRRVMQTVSVWMAARWTARSEEVGSWHILPPDPAAMALWLAFAQGPDLISVYAPSVTNPFADPPQDPVVFSPATWPALKAANEATLLPFGPVIRACSPAPARIALLLSLEGVLAAPRAARPPGWDGELAWPVAAMLVIQGFPFDVMLEEDFAAPNPLARYDAVVVPFSAGLPEGVRRKLAGRRVVDRSFDVAFLRGVDGGLASRVSAADAAERLARFSGELAALLPESARQTRHDPDLAVGHHDGGAVSWHVAVNLALTGVAGATFRDRGIAREAALALRCPPGTVLIDAGSRRPLPVRYADGFAHTRLGLPAAGGVVVAALPGRPGPPRLERTASGALLRAPFAGVMPYDITVDGTERRIATGKDGTRALAASRSISAVCALSGQSARLDM